MHKLWMILSFIFIPASICGTIYLFNSHRTIIYKPLENLITKTNLGNIADSNDQDVIEKIKFLNPGVPDDLYFVDNGLSDWKRYSCGISKAIVKSNLSIGQVSLTYNNTINNNSEKFNTSSAISNWGAANLSRVNKTNLKTKMSKNTYYSEYFDYGMWSKNNINDFAKEGINLKSATIAFVTANQAETQLVIGSDSQIITPIDANIPGTFTHMLKTNYIDPLYKNNNNSFKGMRISFGGASSQAEIWDISMKKFANNKTQIVNDIANNIVNFCKTFAMIALGKSKINDYPKNIDFDIESAHDVGETKGVSYLCQALAKLKSQDNSWQFSLTPAVLPEIGMTSYTIYMLSLIAKSYNDEKLGISDLPVINPMCMDYGTGFSGNKATSEFELARKSVLGVAREYIEALKIYYGTISLDKIIHRMAATPMIGINDTISEVFTLEDAKELYNWAHEIGLAFISNWSGNSDSPGKKLGPTTNGLLYINDKDFSKTLNGDWN